MSEQIVIELWLLDSTYKLSCAPEDAESLKSAAEQLDQKFRTLRNGNPRMDNQKVSVLVALELMQEVLSLNKSLQTYHQAELQLSDIIDKLQDGIQRLGIDE